jgi:ribosomal protein L37E
MGLIKCKNCKKETEHHAKGLCAHCYKKFSWQPEKIICKRCEKQKVHHSQGYCNSCYNFLFHYDLIKEHNYRKWHNLDLETYRKLTKFCNVCGFDKIVELHHIDGNHENNSEKNLAGLCPNHHKMIHMFEFREEIFKILKEKGFEIYNNTSDTRSSV